MMLSGLTAGGSHPALNSTEKSEQKSNNVVPFCALMSGVISRLPPATFRVLIVAAYDTPHIGGAEYAEDCGSTVGVELAPGADSLAHVSLPSHSHVASGIALTIRSAVLSPAYWPSSYGSQSKGLASSRRLTWWRNSSREMRSVMSDPQSTLACPRAA